MSPFRVGPPPAELPPQDRLPSGSCLFNSPKAHWLPPMSALTFCARALPVSLLTLVLIDPSVAADAEITQQGRDIQEPEIWPVLVGHCHEGHSRKSHEDATDDLRRQTRSRRADLPGTTQTVSGSTRDLKFLERVHARTNVQQTTAKDRGQTKWTMLTQPLFDSADSWFLDGPIEGCVT